MTEVIDKLQGKQLSKLKITNCLGCEGSDSFLIRARGANILVDSGFAFCAKEMTEKIKAELQGESLDFVLLTHSHYDHAMGTPLLRREYPDLKVIGSEYCDYILRKPTARAKMQEMDDKAAKSYGFPKAENLTNELYCDITLRDGEEILLGEEKVVAVALPGHTKCCMGFFFKQEKLLVSCETLGIYANEMKVFPGCLIGYRITLDSIQKAEALDMEELLIPHSGILYGDYIKEYLDVSKTVTEECRQLIIKAHKEGADFDKIVEIYKQHYYTPNIAKSYPEHAMMANLSAQIPMFIAECGGEE